MYRVVFVVLLATVFTTAGVSKLSAQGQVSGKEPRSGFFVGAGASYSAGNFGSQSVYNKGISNVFENGVHVAAGEADGPPVLPFLDSHSNFAPVLQAGYFRHFGGSDWLWGAKFSYSYLGMSSSTQNLVIPQFGTSTNAAVSTFTGYSVTSSYSVSIDHQMTALALLGRSFDKGFVYMGGGPSLSRIKSTLQDVVGYATINGTLTNISGAPQTVSSTDWRFGLAATAGLTYFLTPEWFLDLSYLFVAPNSRTIFVSSPFDNPGNGTLAFSGTLIGTFTANVKNTQALSLSINKAF
jgi:opacity protein-like surface antigen